MAEMSFDDLRLLAGLLEDYLKDPLCNIEEESMIYDMIKKIDEEIGRGYRIPTRED